MADARAGITYGNDWYIFDYVFSNYEQANQQVNSFTNGRFVFIKYCNSDLSYSIRQDIEANYTTTRMGEEETYRQNYKIDKDNGKRKSYDRYVLRKTTTGWEEVTCLHPDSNQVIQYWKEV